MFLTVQCFFVEVSGNLPWVPEVFFFVLSCGDNERRTRDRERAKKKSSGHGRYEPHFHANSRQDSLPNRFYVGSVCFRNLTCLRVA